LLIYGPSSVSSGRHGEVKEITIEEAKSFLQRFPAQHDIAEQFNRAKP
jgi:hypothetical protein